MRTDNSKLQGLHKGPACMIEEARCRLDCGVTLELATDSGKLWKGEAISIDIRPENTRIGEGNGTDATFSGAIDLIEHLREVQILYLDLPGTTEKFLIKVDGESSFACRMSASPRACRTFTSSMPRATSFRSQPARQSKRRHLED